MCVYCMLEVLKHSVNSALSLCRLLCPAVMLMGFLVCAQETFQVDFVVRDNSSGVFDNNGGKDYSLPLLGASTEQEILDRRAAIYEAAERERLAVKLSPPFIP